jgi:lipoprotein-releasing system permease protein
LHASKYERKSREKNCYFSARMNFAFYIAKRVASLREEGRFSGLIIRIAVVAIALSMSVMLLATALIAGFKHEIRSKIFGFWGHIHIMHASVDHTLEAYPIDKEQSFYPSLDTLGKLPYQRPFRLFGFEFDNWLIEKETRGGVRHIQAFALKPGIIKVKEEMEGIVVKGVGTDFDWSYLNKYLEEGSPIQWQDSLPSDKILISRITADRLRLELGDKFILYFVEKGDQLRRRFEVGGIYKTGLAEYDQKFAIADIRKIQNVLGWEEDQVSGFEVFLDDVEDMEVFKAYLFEFELPLELFAETMREKDPSIFDWLELQDINEAVILVLMIIVAIINTVTALLILILERTNMIGTLKAIGAGNWMVQKIFLYHAAYIITWGLIWGNFIGLGLAFLQDQFRIIRLAEADYFLSYAPIHWDITTIILLNIGTLAVTLLFLIIPSFLVSSISPVKAIRFK